MADLSDIGLCLSKDALMAFDASLKKVANQEIHQLVEKLLSTREKILMDAPTNSELWFWNSIKWYPEYQEVAFIEKFLLTLDEDEYLLIRTGVSTGDVDTWGTYHDNPFGMYLSCAIVFDKTGENL